MHFYPDKPSSHCSKLSLELEFLNVDIIFSFTKYGYNKNDRAIPRVKNKIFQHPRKTHDFKKSCTIFPNYEVILTLLSTI